MVFAKFTELKLQGNLLRKHLDSLVDWNSGQLSYTVFLLYFHGLVENWMFAFKISWIHVPLIETFKSALNVGCIVLCYSALFQIRMIVCSFMCIMGYCVYQNNWFATHGEILDCVREMHNRNNPF